MKELMKNDGNNEKYYNKTNIRIRITLIIAKGRRAYCVVICVPLLFGNVRRAAEKEGGGQNKRLSLFN